MKNLIDNLDKAIAKLDSLKGLELNDDLIKKVLGDTGWYAGDKIIRKSYIIDDKELVITHEYNYQFDEEPACATLDLFQRANEDDPESFDTQLYSHSIGPRDGMK